MKTRDVSAAIAVLRGASRELVHELVPDPAPATRALRALSLEHAIAILEAAPALLALARAADADCDEYAWRKGVLEASDDPKLRALLDETEKT